MSLWLHNIILKTQNSSQKYKFQYT